MCKSICKGLNSQGSNTCINSYPVLIIPIISSHFKPPKLPSLAYFLYKAQFKMYSGTDLKCRLKYGDISHIIVVKYSFKGYLWRGKNNCLSSAS